MMRFRSTFKREETSKKWIVLTTISAPTEQVEYLSNITGWRCLVVGDSKTPLTWSLPGCDYLSIEAQEELGFAITKATPYGSYTRKNIGYLYAIIHGAEFIYETDDDNRPLDNLEGFVYKSTMSGLVFTGDGVFNPYVHFGQSTLWPRGFPLSHIGVPQRPLYKLGSQWKTPAIQQGIVNGDPDMDAIFRLTRKSTTAPLNVIFDPASPPAILPKGVFSPFNSQNTLFHSEAFWALFIPKTTTIRVCDIWRGYWAQRLLWEVGGSLGFFPANAFQKRNAHSYLKDALEEKDMYFQTENLLRFLRSWDCGKDLSFFQCVLKLSSDMADHNFWKTDDVLMTKLWLDDLKSVGYIEPERVGFNLNFSETLQYSQILNENVDYLPVIGKGDNVSDVVYSSVEQPSPSVYATPTRNNGFCHKMKKITSMCGGLLNNQPPQVYEGRLKSANFFSDILLIIVFNNPYYGNVKYLDAIHSPVFTNILYCGENITKFQDETKDMNQTFSFIEAEVVDGFDGYICAIRAMQMGYSVSGYLFTSDDLLFKPWAMLELNKSSAGVTYESRTIFLNISEPVNTYFRWGEKIGRTAYLKTLSDISIVPRIPDGVRSLEEFQKTLLTHTNSKDLVVGDISDLYYIPQKMRAAAVWYLSMFYKNHVFLELAVPCVLRGLETKQSLNLFGGKSYYGDERERVFSTYYLHKYFFHPAKLSMSKMIEGYCNLYFPELLEKLFNATEA
ncbi:uncharacterized protein LOC131942311 [Physella acuta]|uniref:uncharacterized protein LOC131942311 n=1 Tax=Physella acuta TaxID=109671 RepID=UPI0027DC3436|nr:uncharacterized protein LOC131942311 [Physella acuta]